MNKPKLLAWCDFNTASGFSTVSMQLLRDLHEKYEVHVVGINYYGDTIYDTSKYFVYSAPGGNDFFNKRRLLQKAQELQPDVIFLLQDLVHMRDILPKLRTIAESSKIVGYFPVDGTPLSPYYQEVFVCLDTVITYSEYAKTAIQKYFKVPQKIHVMYHGVDFDVFHPLATDAVKELREKLKWKNKFTVINVNRFQPRKDIYSSLRAWSMFSKGLKYCKPCDHYMPKHLTSCELCGSGELKSFGRKRKDVVLYLHMNARDGYGPSIVDSLENLAISAGFVEEDFKEDGVIVLQGENIYEAKIPAEFVNQIYNASNLVISTANGEGAGLSLIESQATGTEVLAPYNSAIPEQFKGVPNQEFFKNKYVHVGPGDMGCVRPIVDAKNVVDLLEKKYNFWKNQKEEKVIFPELLQNVFVNHNWDKIREQFVDILENE